MDYQQREVLAACERLTVEALVSWQAAKSPLDWICASSSPIGCDSWSGCVSYCAESRVGEYWYCQRNIYHRLSFHFWKAMTTIGLQALRDPGYKSDHGYWRALMPHGPCFQRSALSKWCALQGWLASRLVYPLSALVEWVGRRLLDWTYPSDSDFLSEIWTCFFRGLKGHVGCCFVRGC